MYSPDALQVHVHLAGEAVMGARVTLLDLQSLMEWSASTDSSGTAILEASPAGVCRLQVRAQGADPVVLPLDRSEVIGSTVVANLTPVQPEGWILAVEVRTAEQADALAAASGETQEGIPDAELLLLSSSDGISWSRMEGVPPLTGTSPDVEWDAGDLLLVLGNGTSGYGQKHVRMMRHDASLDRWLGPEPVGTDSEAVRAGSAGVMEAHHLNRETGLFRLPDGTIHGVGMNHPDGLFYDMKLSNPEKRTWFHKSVCGFSSLVPGYGGGLFRDTLDRYRLLVEDDDTLSQPDVVVLGGRTWLVLQGKEGLYALDVASPSMSPVELLESLPAVMAPGRFRGVSVSAGKDDAGCLLAYGTGTGAVCLVSCDSLEGPVSLDSPQACITAESLGYPTGTVLMNPGLCRVPEATGLVWPEGKSGMPATGRPDDVRIWNDAERWKHDPFFLKGENPGTPVSLPNRMAAVDGVLEEVTLNLSAGYTYQLYDHELAAEDFVLNVPVSLAGLSEVGCCFDMRLAGFEQELLALRLSRDAWMLESLDCRQDLTYFGERMGETGMKHTLLAEGACILPEGASMITFWKENRVMRVLADGDLVAEAVLPDVLSGGLFGLLLTANDATVAFPLDFRRMESLVLK